ncbi:hypothetical protein N9954_00245 [Maribacter sp.]|nr:hypothetical protein [Maribacter sp.]
MKFSLTILFTIVGFLVNAQEQKLVYDLSVADNSIGTLTTTKTQNANATVYTTTSDVTVHIFGETKITTALNVTYLNNVLQSSNYKIEKNGMPNDESTTTLKNSVYTITHNGKTSEINIPITYSTINLYFEEPKNIEKVFAELEGITKNITNIGASDYQLTDPGNHHTNKYSYDKVKLKEAVISHELFNFKLSLKE